MALHLAIKKVKKIQNDLIYCWWLKTLSSMIEFVK